MRLLPLVLLLLPAAASADVVPAPDGACRDPNRVEMAAGRDATPGFRRLDRLPPAAEYLTVYRRVGRCPAPVVVRYGIGAPRR
ncbi:MAG: hypothetical protein JO290_09965 [Sphingomonadaceae bacterium]|nr:hypothetical protein [Sphingomonadaceae bacterium]